LFVIYRSGLIYNKNPTACSSTID